MSSTTKIYKKLIDKKIMFFVFIFFISILSIFIFNNKEEEKKINCYDYIVSSMKEIGWDLYNDSLFVSRYNESTFLVLSSNFITFKIKDTEDRLNVYLDDDVIYLNEDSKKENINEFEKYKDYIRYDDFKLHVFNVHRKLEEVGCNLSGKRPHTLSYYKEKNIN